MRFPYSLVIAMMLALSGSAYCAEVRITGTFTNLSYNIESGDLLGTEILIVPGQGGFVAFVQLAEGGEPFSALVPPKVEGPRIEFTMPEHGSYAGLKFSGAVSTTELVGRWSSGQREVMKRGVSYWDSKAGLPATRRRR